MPLPMFVLFAVFFTLVGACVGSFLNVVIWRLPYRGHEVTYLNKKGRMTLSWPPSHCPMCDATIHWYQNIPVLSYILLGGKCARCKAAIPIRYPLVELATALLWLGLYLAYFAAGWQARVYPWQANGAIGLTDFRTDWPPLVAHAVFASALLAASAIDADLFIIPLSIPWFLGIFGVIAAVAGGQQLPDFAKTFAIMPSLNDATWGLGKPVIGAVVGVMAANVLVGLKILPRSFPWELEEQREEADTEPGTATSSAKETGGEKDEPLAPPPKLTRFGPSVIAALAIVAAVVGLWAGGFHQAAGLAGVGGAILIFLIGVLPRDQGQVDVTDDVVEEISEGNVRQEILKEVVFLAIPVACAELAHLVPGELPHAAWLGHLLGSLLGALVGGALVWLIRVGGSLAFNKQAMGLGDVHLMTGVGAMLGAPLVVIAFFMAPFLGIIWAMVLKVMGKANVLPYGPWLSVASILALLVGNPLLCLLLPGVC